MHGKVVAWLWRRLRRRGAIVMGTHAAWYCTSDEAFLTETQVCTREEFLRRRAAERDAHVEAVESAGRGPAQAGAAAAGKTAEDDVEAELAALSADARLQKVSAESGHPVEWVTEHNYIFKLSEWQEPLLRWLRSRPDVVVPENRLNEVVAFVEGGLRDLSVSRRSDKVGWALRVPDDPAHSIYVWLDALTNYLTASMRPEPAASNNEPLADDMDPQAVFTAWPAAVHVVGKDILRFHAVYWPAFLMAAKLEPPRQILAHGHWTVGRTKMSKSLGNVVNPLELIQPHGQLTRDAVRYFLLREGSLSADGDFSHDVLRIRAVSECADTLGNLAARALTASFLPAGRLPFPFRNADAALCHLNEEERRHVGVLHSVRDQVSADFEARRIPSALEHAMRAVAEVNRLFALAEPWKLRKAQSQDAAQRLSAVMYVTLETLRIAAILLSPAMPDASEVLLKRLTSSCTNPHAPPNWSRAVFGAVQPTAYCVQVEPTLVLFPKPPPMKTSSSAPAPKRPSSKRS